MSTEYETEFRRVRDLLREILGWTKIDALISEFGEYGAMIAQLDVRGFDELWSSALNAAMQQIVKENLARNGVLSDV